MEHVSVSSGCSSQTDDRYTFALLTDRFLPHAGGSRVYYHNLYKRVSSAFGHEVVVLTSEVPGWADFDRQNSTPNFRIIRRSSPLDNWKYYQAPKLFPPLIRTWRLMNSQRIDMLHVGDLLPQGLIGLFAKRAFGTPFLIYAHGEEITQMDRRRYQPMLRDAIYRNADVVIAANNFARDSLIRIGTPEERIHTIFPGVDCQRFSPRDTRHDLVEQLQLQGTMVLLSVGRLVPRKGHDVVLRALAKLPNDMPQYRYVIVGEGPERPRLEQLARELNLSDRVIFKGKIPDSELPDYYNLCDLFVLANRDIEGDLEAFGMVFLEANACGKPVLGGRTGGTADAVNDGITGLLFDPENIDDVARSLELLMNSAHLRQRFGEAGRRRAITDFSWDTGSRRLNNVCLNLLAHRHRFHRAH